MRCKNDNIALFAPSPNIFFSITEILESDSAQAIDMSNYCRVICCQKYVAVSQVSRETKVASFPQQVLQPENDAPYILEKIYDFW